jgi:pimeloyl-ACP methyl ester carboxylesterase
VRVSRPRLLLVPTVSELEWRIQPELSEWADIAVFDAPGVGGEPAEGFTVDAIVERGVAELDRRGWERCVLVSDEFGSVIAARIAAGRPDGVEALALGHAVLSLRSTGERAPINGEVHEAFLRLARTDYGSYVRALSQITQDAYDEDWVERYRERVPKEAALALEDIHSDADEETTVEELIRPLDVPMLFVGHRGCLLFTSEGFEDAAAAFPAAKIAWTDAKPSADPRFSELLREFCAELEPARA